MRWNMHYEVLWRSHEKGNASARLLLAGLLVTANANMVLAQSSTARAPLTSNPQLKLSPMKTLQSFEPAENEEYALGPGDEISLDFPGRPELSGKKVVGPDGRITLSLAGASTSQTRTETRSPSWWSSSIALLQRPHGDRKHRQVRLQSNRHYRKRAASRRALLRQYPHPA